MPEGMKVGSAYIEVRADAKRAKEDLKNLKKHVEGTEADVQVGADTAIAARQIEYVSRARVSMITVKAVGIPAVEKSLARLSGLRTINDNVKSLGTSLANLDKTAPKVAKVSTAVGVLSASVLAGSSNLLVLGGSIASIAPAALALPGMFGAAAIGAGVLKLALKDTATVLADLVPAFQNVQSSVSANFWDKAAEPIRVMVNDLLPQYQGKLDEVASTMGSFAATMSGHMSQVFGGGALDSLFSSLTGAITALEPAIRPFLDSVVTLGTSGAAYLPMLSTWLSRIAGDFNTFVQGAASDGRLDQWIQTGIGALQDLGRVVGNLGGIFYGLYSAAEAAGGATLDTLANGLERLNAVVNGPAFQGALTTVFKGAHEAMVGLGDASGPLADMFVSLAPVIGNVLGLLGHLAGDVLGTLASALARPEFGNSLTVMFEGLDRGVRAILPAVPTLVSAFGKFAETIGKVMEILGPIFSVAIETLAPVFESVLSAILPVAEVLGGALASALEKVGPFVQDLAEKFASFVKENPQMATTLLVVVGAVTAIASAVISAIPTILSITSGFTAFMSSIGGSGTVLTVLRTAFTALTGPIGLIIGALVTAYATSKPFREAINGLIGMLMSLVSTIVGSVTPIFNTLISLFKMIVDEAITPLVSALTAILIPIFNSLVPVIQTVFGFISATITNVMTVIQGVIKVVTGLIKGDWTAVWDGIKLIFSGVWAQIKNILTTALTLVQQVINVALTTIRVLWETIWNTIKNVLSTIWTGIKSVISSGVEVVKSLVSAGFTWVRDTATNLWNGLKDNLSNIWNHHIKPVFQAVADFIMKDVPGAFDKGVQSIKGFWDKLKEIAKAPIKFMIDTVYNDGIRGVFNKVMDFIGSGNTMGRLTVPGFRTGGYTGDMGADQVAGVVHGKEFVFTEAQTAAIGKDKLASIASGASRGIASGCAHAAGAAHNEGAAGGGNMGGYFMGNVGQIARHKAMYLNVANGMAPWNFGGAASLWDGAAGVKVKTGRGQHQAQVTPLERGGGILGFSSNTNIDMSPSWMNQLGATQRRTVAAHEIGHSLGLPHNSGSSIMQPNLGQMAAVPTANDIANLQSLYPGGSGKVGSGEGFNPLKWVTDKITAGIGNMLDRIPGAGKVLEMALGVAKKMIEVGKQWAIDKVTGSDGDNEGGASIGAGARINPTVFDGGGMLEQGMVGIHNKRVPDKVLTDQQWNTMKNIADNAASGHDIIEQHNEFNVTIDASSIRDIQHMTDIFNNLSQVARAGRGTPNARIA